MNDSMEELQSRTQELGARVDRIETRLDETVETVDYLVQCVDGSSEEPKHFSGQELLNLMQRKQEGGGLQGRVSTLEGKIDKLERVLVTLSQRYLDSKQEAGEKATARSTAERADDRKTWYPNAKQWKIIWLTTIPTLISLISHAGALALAIFSVGGLLLWKSSGSSKSQS